MALVMKTDMVENHLNTKMAVTDGVTVNVAVDGVTHMDVVTYPAQGEFTEGAVLALIQKPFIDFAKSCGDAGAMTADMITAKYGDAVPAALATTIAADFTKAYKNYMPIPDGMTLMITAEPISSVFAIMVKEEEPIDTTAEEK